MKKVADIYVKYVAKNPILFLALVIVSVSSIMIMTLTTKTNLIVTYNAIIDKDTIRIEEVVQPNANFLYVYSNRNEYVYRVEVSELQYDKGSTTFFVVETDELGQLEQKGIQVDIPIKEISLFERIFLRGGKGSE